MTRIAEYPDEITDVHAWRAELAMVAYRDGKLTLPQVAEFLALTQLEACRMLEAHGLSVSEDEVWLAQELDGATATVRHATTRR